MLSPAYTFRLDQPILPGLVAVGKFDGKTPSLACATNGGKILLHSPHEGAQYNDSQLPSIRMLNFNRKVTALAAGCLGNKGTSNADLLIAGTQSNLLAYDVDRNADVFFRDCPDGVNAITIGKIGTIAEPLVVTGGNCSVLGFDKTGNEAFWTVTSDNISALTLSDVDNDGYQELLVGSEDFEIRAFKQEELLAEIGEADKVTMLSSMPNGAFAYGLANGTVGAYAGMRSRIWRVKTKHRPTALIGFDINGDGVAEVVSGWSNGSFNVRHADNGEVLFRAGSLGGSVASMVRANYRMDDKEQLLVCLENGVVKGFELADAESASAQIAMHSSGPSMGTGVDADLADTSYDPDRLIVQRSEDQKVLDELQAKKIELLNELKRVESSANSKLEMNGGLPEDTNVEYKLVPDALGVVGVRVTVNNDVQIASILAIDLDGGNLAGTDVAVFSPTSTSSTAVIPLKLSKNQACEFMVQVHLTTRAMTGQLFVMESKVRIPKFASFRYVQSSKEAPEAGGEIRFNWNERIGRIEEWIRSSFLVEPTFAVNGDKLKAYFLSSNSGAENKSSSRWQGSQSTSDVVNLPIHIHAQYIDKNDGRSPRDSSSPSRQLSCRIRCGNMELGAELIQDLATFCNITELQTEVNFSREFDQFAEVLQRVEDCNSSRIRLAADMADDSSRVKALIIRAEDSRIMADMSTMRRSYTDLFTTNSQLIGGYNVRAQNHEALLAALKDVNLMIQRAANLRVGKAKTKVVTECRQAVKANNMRELLQIIQAGSSAKV